MSVRRFCAVEDELWDNVPSRAPNNLCPRLRSSTCPLFRRSDARSRGAVDVVGDAAESALELLSPRLNRGRFACSSEKEDWRRLRVRGEALGGSIDSSGTITAEATAL